MAASMRDYLQPKLIRGAVSAPIKCNFPKFPLSSFFFCDSRRQSATPGRVIRMSGRGIRGVNALYPRSNVEWATCSGLSDVCATTRSLWIRCTAYNKVLIYKIYSCRMSKVRMCEMLQYRFIYMYACVL